MPEYCFNPSTRVFGRNSTPVLTSVAQDIFNAPSRLTFTTFLHQKDAQGMQGVMIQPAFSQAERKAHIKKYFNFNISRGPRGQTGPSGTSSAPLLPGTEHRTPSSCLQLGAVGGAQVITSTHQRPPAFQGSPASCRIPVSSKPQQEEITPHLVLLKFPESRTALPILASRHPVLTT